MKLYFVEVWASWDSESGSSEILVAETIEMAEKKALKGDYYDSSCAKEIDEIDGYKIFLAKV